MFGFINYMQLHGGETLVSLCFLMVIFSNKKVTVVTASLFVACMAIIASYFIVNFGTSYRIAKTNILIYPGDLEKYGGSVASVKPYEIITLVTSKTTVSRSVFALEIRGESDVRQVDLTQPLDQHLVTLECEFPEDCFRKDYPAKNVVDDKAYIRIELSCKADTFECLRRIEQKKRDIQDVVSLMAKENSRTIQIEL